MVVRVIEAKEDKVTMADLIADFAVAGKFVINGTFFLYQLIIQALFLLLKELFVEKKKT